MTKAIKLVIKLTGILSIKGLKNNLYRIKLINEFSDVNVIEHCQNIVLSIIFFIYSIRQEKVTH